jgi:hypothetical protein
LGENIVNAPTSRWDDGAGLISLLDMIRNYGYLVASIAKLLGEFERITRHEFRVQEDGNFRDPDLRLANSFVQVLKSSLFGMREMHLELSLMYAEDLIEIWEKSDLGFKRIVDGDMIGILYGRIEDELKTRFFMYLPSGKAEQYNKPLKGWEEILVRFPEVLGDLEEMNRCYAVSRYSASVFHSVSLIEHGLIALGAFLGVKDPKSGWTAVCGELEKLVIKTKFPDLDKKFQTHFGFLEQTHGTTMALKNSWRNKISHAHARLVVLTPDFTPEIAEEIIFATRAFMRRLATEMP